MIHALLITGLALALAVVAYCLGRLHEPKAQTPKPQQQAQQENWYEKEWL